MTRIIPEHSSAIKIKPLKCPYCKQSWLFVSKYNIRCLNSYNYGSDYENKGYQVNCKCGRFNKLVRWKKTKEQAIEEWNNIMDIAMREAKNDTTN